MSGPGKGKVGIYFELPADEAAAFRKYAKDRGETLAVAAGRAFRRERSNPPPPPTDAPLPSEPDPKKRKGK